MRVLTLMYPASVALLRKRKVNMGNAVKGNKKSSKKDQPKRKRYNIENRAVKNKIKKLKKHLRVYSSDKVAQATLEKLSAGK